VICGAFLEVCHALFELLLLTSVLFELSYDGILLNDLGTRDSLASSLTALSNYREGTHLEIDLPTRISHAELWHVCAAIGTGAIGEGCLFLDGRAIIIWVGGDICPLSG